jgi:hypothetical protein
VNGSTDDKGGWQNFTHRPGSKNTTGATIPLVRDRIEIYCGDKIEAMVRRKLWEERRGRSRPR